MSKCIGGSPISWWTVSHLCYCYLCQKGEWQLVLYPLPKKCQKCAKGSVHTLSLKLKHGSEHMHRVKVFSLPSLSSSCSLQSCSLTHLCVQETSCGCCHLDRRRQSETHLDLYVLPILQKIKDCIPTSFFSSHE